MTLTDEERDKTLKGLSQDGVIAYALNFLNFLIEKNEKEWKELDKLSLGFDTPSKTSLSIHKIGLKNIKKILEYYER
jgi:archaellum component FlaD/FlaE